MRTDDFDRTDYNHRTKWIHTFRYVYIVYAHSMRISTEVILIIIIIMYICVHVCVCVCVCVCVYVVIHTTKK